MKPQRFALTSEQLELLLAFEAVPGLQPLAEHLSRDPSVISRHLQTLAETQPVIKKHKGKWRLTEQGKRINHLSRRYLAELHALTEEPASTWEDTLLVIVNAQQALRQGQRSKTSEESNMALVLAHWRKHGRPIAHVKHVSTHLDSLFHDTRATASFIPALAPRANEHVFEKTKASAFSSKPFAAFVEKQAIERVVIVGFTAGECVDATARDASARDLVTYVISDASVTFDLRGPDGKLHKAERVHRLVMANLHAFFATVVETQELLR